MVRFLHIFPRRHLLAAAIIAAAMTVFGAAGAHAEEASTTGLEQITLSPTSKKHSLKPGETITDSFKVVNTGDVGFAFIVYGQPYSVSDMTYAPDFTSNAPRADAHTWATFDETELYLQPGERKDIEYTLKVPESAGLGGHYGVIFAETQPEEGEGGQQILRQKRVGMILRVTVEGDTRESGEVVASRLAFMQFRAPLRSSLEIKNDGNVDFDVDSSIVVKDLFGSVKHRYNKTSAVYPDTTRLIDQNWDGVSWLGFYKVDVAATYLGKDFQESRYVLVMPFWLILVIVMVTIAGAYAYYLRKE